MLYCITFSTEPDFFFPIVLEYRYEVPTKTDNDPNYEVVPVIMPEAKSRFLFKNNMNMT